MEMTEYESYVIIKCKARSELEAGLRVNKMLEIAKKDDDMTINLISTAPTYYWMNHIIS